MRSPQTLSEEDRGVVSGWAADCAERVLGVFEAQAPGDRRPRNAIGRARAFSRGELEVAEEIRRRFRDGGAAREAADPAAKAAAKAAGQAAAISHMGAHALGVAAYAAMAVSLVEPDSPDAAREEIHWQLEHMSPAVAAALRSLPAVGTNASGPLGPGLLARGVLGTIIRDLQAALAIRRGEPGPTPGHQEPPPRYSQAERLPHLVARPRLPRIKPPRDMGARTFHSSESWPRTLAC